MARSRFSHVALGGADAVGRLNVRRAASRTMRRDVTVAEAPQFAVLFFFFNSSPSELVQGQDPLARFSSSLQCRVEEHRHKLVPVMRGLPNGLTPSPVKIKMPISSKIL